MREREPNDCILVSFSLTVRAISSNSVGTMFKIWTKSMSGKSMYCAQRYPEAMLLASYPCLYCLIIWGDSIIVPGTCVISAGKVNTIYRLSWNLVKKVNKANSWHVSLYWTKTTLNSFSTLVVVLQGRGKGHKEKSNSPPADWRCNCRATQASTNRPMYK